MNSKTTMDLKRNFFIRHAFLIAVLLTYFVAGGFLFYFTAYYTDYLDTVFYLHISEKYAHGNFYDAINNYWSPMISWLLVPFRLLQADPMVSFKVLQLLTGAMTLYLSFELAKKLIGENIQAKIFMICLIPVYLSYALLYMTPDLLFLTTLLLMFLQLLSMADNITGISIRQCVYAGATGAALYFTKSYGLPFFITAISLPAIILLLKSKKNERGFILKKYFIALSVFLFLAAGWMFCLAHKYGSFSAGYASTYNFSLLAPGRYEPGQPLKHPMFGNGLMPVEAGHVSIWESPSVMESKTWSPLESKSNAAHFLHIVSFNWVSFYYFMISRNTGMLFLITLLIYFIFIRKPFSRMTMPVKLLLVWMIIFTSGYSLVFFMPRYIWICNILMILVMITLWKQLVAEKKYLRLLGAVFLCLAFFLEIKKPMKELLFRHDAPMHMQELVSGFIHPVSALKTSYAGSMQLPLIIRRIKSLELPPGNAAGIAADDPVRFSYTQSLLLCMYTGMPFYGELPVNLQQPALIKALRQHQIRYLYTWQQTVPVPVDNRKLLVDPVAGFTLTGVNP